jgi:hypothetical protein
MTGDGSGQRRARLPVDQVPGKHMASPPCPGKHVATAALCSSDGGPMRGGGRGAPAPPEKDAREQSAFSLLVRRGPRGFPSENRGRPPMGNQGGTRGNEGKQRETLVKPEKQEKTRETRETSGKKRNSQGKQGERIARRAESAAGPTGGGGSPHVRRRGRRGVRAGRLPEHTAGLIKNLPCNGG